MRQFVAAQPLPAPGDEVQPDRTMLPWVDFLRAHGIEALYPVGTIAEVMADMGDRIGGVTQQTTNAIDWTGDLLSLRIRQDSLRDRLAMQLDSLERDFNRLTAVAEDLPGVSREVAAELNAALAEAMATFNAGVDNAFADIDRQRMALQHYVSAEREALVAQAQQAAEELPQLTITQSPAGVPTVASDEAGALSLQEIYRRCIGSVVSIVTVTPSGKASGTGIIMSEDGYVITNHHVIESAQAVSVLTADSREYTASIIGSDETSDLAVLKIEAEGLQAAEFGDSSVLQVGDSVAAIGDPLGTALRGTMTDGIVSAINRDLTVNDRTMSLIQTNAALNNGNSGGPLINCYGQVIGINTMKMSNFYSSSTTVEGIGFAIPIDTAKPIIDELIEKGYVSGRPAIGIDGETLPATYRIYYRLPQGIYVTRVYRNSDAAAKGISEGDIITAINGVSVTTMEQLNRVKNQFTAGQTITLTIYHGGVSSDVEIILMDRANA